MPYPLITRGSLIASAGAVALSSAAAILVYLNTQETASEKSLPLPVTVVNYAPDDYYVRRARLLGVVRAASDSALGFEVAGTVESMRARAGTRVNKGDVLAALNSDRRSAELRAAQADVARIRIQLELAGLQRERLAELANKGLASKQAFDEARLGETALQAEMAATQARLNNAELAIEKSTLRAPYDGVIAARLVEEGAAVNPGMPVLRLVANTGYEAHVGIPMAFSAQLTEGNSYVLRIDDQVISAPLRAIRADLDPTTLTIGATFTLPKQTAVRAGTGVVLELQERINSRGGWLPLTALIEGEKGLWNILVVQTNASGFYVNRETVEVLHTDNNKVYVRGTLANNARVVATGVHRLSPGATVEPMNYGEQ